MSDNQKIKQTNQHITKRIMQLQGVDISKYDDTFLNKSIQKRIIETNCKSFEEYHSFVDQNSEESESFLKSLHISYSEFFRNSLTFSVLEHIVLPSILTQKKNTQQKEVRIWSAACAGGQESYSLAILMEELKHDDIEKYSYRIFATDQDQTQVNEAQKGQYLAEALNNISLKRANHWLDKQGDTFTIKQVLKTNIDFSVFDLFSEKLSSPPASIFGNFDLVVCANLLFYYKPEYQQVILKKIGNALTKEGYIICGETERDILMRYNFKEVFPQSGIFKK